MGARGKWYQANILGTNNLLNHAIRIYLATTINPPSQFLRAAETSSIIVCVSSS